VFRFFIVLCLCSLSSVYAAVDTYKFKDVATQSRFQDLAADLRCPKCQNQNLADSNAAIAQDLRQKIYEMLEAGKTNTEIVDYMVARYGDFVLYEPRFNGQNAILWLAPFSLLFIGLLVVIYLTRYRNKQRLNADEVPMALDAKQQKRLKAVLNKDKYK